MAYQENWFFFFNISDIMAIKQWKQIWNTFYHQESDAFSIKIHSQLKLKLKSGTLLYNEDQSHKFNAAI